MERRTFLKSMAALPAAGVATADDKPPLQARAKAAAGMVALQIHPFSFYDEGLERVLDTVAETAGVNALLVYSHLYGADQTMPEEVLAPDHGVKPKAGARDLQRVWVRHSADAFEGLMLRHPKDDEGAEYFGKDVFADLAEPARKRGMKVLARILEPNGPAYLGVIPNWSRVLAVDIDGRPGRSACWNHPEYRAWWLATVRDILRTYPLDGFMFGAERVGPLSRLLYQGETPQCFCRYCRERARDQGIDLKRVKEGFAEMRRVVLALRGGAPAGPSGAFTDVLRVVMRYPEVLSWEYDWARSLEEVVAGVGGTVKTARPEALYGRHVDHQQTTWNPFYKACVDIRELAEPVDFIKPATYHEIAAPRVRAQHVEALRKSLFRDLPAELGVAAFYAMNGLDAAKEPKADEMMAEGLTADYVYRETRKFVRGVAGAAAVLPGIGMDIPYHWADGPKRFPSHADSVYRATLKAYEAGADGIVVSREYQEMRIPNLKAVGRAVREVGAAKRGGA